MTFATAIAEDRRLSVLLLLDASPGSTANEALLQCGLPEFGHHPSADVVSADLAWLREVGAVTLASEHGLVVAALTQRGVDAAHGRAVVPGIKRPRPAL